jgi:hypothetical protein
VEILEVDMARIEDTLWCDNCGVEIHGIPTVKDGYYYCCEDCRDGLLCECMGCLEFEEERRAQIASASIFSQYGALT